MKQSLKGWIIHLFFRAHCESMNAARTLSAPDFGKIIKCVFPRVKARRLGTRGNSKYPFRLHLKTNYVSFLSASLFQYNIDICLELCYVFINHSCDSFTLCMTWHSRDGVNSYQTVLVCHHYPPPSKYLIVYNMYHYSTFSCFYFFKWIEW